MKWTARTRRAGFLFHLFRIVKSGGVYAILLRRLSNKFMQRMKLKEYRRKTKTAPRKAQPEYDLQKMVCGYLNHHYPDVPFESSVINLRLTIGQGKRMKAISDHNFKTPDLKIYRAARGFHGLMIELKAESPYQQTGELYSSEHLAAQNAAIDALRAAGYYALFAWEFNEIKTLLDWYLGGNDK